MGDATGSDVTRVFIGHGRSTAWRDLKDFLCERLGIAYEEFNREPAAGIATTERLKSMLERATFAFLVMTAEDTHHDGTHHARENVIHEAGLFQGRLGFERAIILLEDGTAEFSNLHGVTQIRFPRGNLMAVSEEIRRVLERERILASGPTRNAEPSPAASGPQPGRPRHDQVGNIDVKTGALKQSSINVHVGDNKGRSETS